MGPDFGQIERIETIGSGLGIGHYLYRQGPAWVLAAGDSVKQIATVEVRISAGHGRGYRVAEKFHALMRVVMVLHPKLLALSVDPHKGVRSVPGHVAPRATQSALAHQIGDLVGGFGVVGPEVPLHVVVAQT